MRHKAHIAATSNFAALNLPQAVLGEYNWWTIDGTNYLLHCRPPSKHDAKTYLASVGAVNAPDCHNPTSQVGVSFAAICPASAGVLATDTAWTAFAKIATVAGILFNPEEM